MSNSIIHTIYNKTLRPYLPRKISVYSGIPVRSAKLFDINDHHPDYKKGLIDAIHEVVGDGDTVTLVGFGRGVSTVHCLRSGADRVIAYEAAAEMCRIGHETLGLTNSVPFVDIQHAIVGEDIEVYGNSTNATAVAPTEIHHGDVLLLDCEGAEASILEGLDWRPPTCVVETHPERGVPTEQTATILADLGYNIHRRLYEPEQEHKSKRILIGTNPQTMVEQTNWSEDSISDRSVEAD